MQNSIYKIKYLLFLSWDWEAWCLTVRGGGNTPSPKETLLEIRGGNVFTCPGAPNNLIRPWGGGSWKLTSVKTEGSLCGRPTMSNFVSRFPVL